MRVLRVWGATMWMSLSCTALSLRTVGATGRQANILPRIAVPMSKYQNAVIPAFERLKASGRIGAWGVTTASTQRENLAVVGATERPDVVQCITNVLDSSASMALAEEVPMPRQVISKAQDAGIGVMGIRAVAAGSLTDAIDRDVHPKSAELKDFQRSAGFRELAKSNGLSACLPGPFVCLVHARGGHCGVRCEEPRRA